MSFAIAVGYLLHRYATVDAIASPIIDFSRYIPVAAIIPVTIILFGIDDLQRISVLVFGTVFYAIVLVTAGFNNVPQEYRDLGTVAGLNRRQLFRRVTWPAALPEVWQAVRISAGICWSYILVAEIVAADTGIGFLVIRAQRFLQMDTLFALVIVTGMVGLVYDRVIVMLSKMTCAWAFEKR